MRRLFIRVLALGTAFVLLSGCATAGLNWAASDKATFELEVVSLRSKPLEDGEQQLCLRLRNQDNQETEWQKSTADDGRGFVALVLQDEQDADYQIESHGWQQLPCDNSFSLTAMPAFAEDDDPNRVDVFGRPFHLPASVDEQVIAWEQPVPCGGLERQLFYLQRDQQGVMKIYSISHAQRYARPNRALWLLAPVTVATDILLSPIYAGIAIVNAARCDGDVWCDPN